MGEIEKFLAVHGKHCLVGGDDFLARFQSFTNPGAGMIFTTHQLDFAERLADQVVVLADGRVVATGTYDETRLLISLWYPSNQRTIDLDRAYVEVRGWFDAKEEHWFKLADAPGESDQSTLRRDAGEPPGRTTAWIRPTPAGRPCSSPSKIGSAARAPLGWARRGLGSWAVGLL